MDTWILLAVAGAFLQNLRTALQKTLTGRVDVLGAAYARFFYAWPFAALYLLVLAPAVEINGRFLLFAGIGALGQIAGTVYLLRAFATRSFAVATALSKTETVQTVLLGAIVLSEGVAPLAAAGIGVSLIGLWLLSPPPEGGWSGFRLDRGMGYGLLAGAGLAVAAVGYRGAALALPGLDVMAQAACTLALALTLQSLLMGLWLQRRAPGVLTSVLRAWPNGLWIGLFGAAASACWFTAMALVSAGYVRAVGQVELLFSFLVSVLWFRERTTARDVVGVLVLCAGIVAVLLGA